MSLPVGADIESMCGKCGDVWHVVAAKVGDKIAKVVCKQCGQQHRYKAPEGKADANAVPGKPPKVAKAKKAAGTGTKRRSAKAIADSTPLIAIDPNKPARVYKPTETFKAGDAITHPSFGTGVVELIPGPGKIQCFFPGGRRVLAMIKAASAGLEKPMSREELAIKGKPPKGL
jgi:transcription elongation factor Elf1